MKNFEQFVNEKYGEYYSYQSSPKGLSVEDLIKYFTKNIPIEDKSSAISLNDELVTSLDVEVSDNVNLLINKRVSSHGLSVFDIMQELNKVDDKSLTIKIGNKIIKSVDFDKDGSRVELTLK